MSESFATDFDAIIHRHIEMADWQNVEQAMTYIRGEVYNGRCLRFSSNRFPTMNDRRLASKQDFLSFYCDLNKLLTSHGKKLELGAGHEVQCTDI